MPIRITGMNSGLDTESIITALVSGYKSKKDKLVKAQTKQSWKMDAWKGVNTKVYDLYKSLDKMRLSTAGYKTKKTTVSDSTKATVTASNSAVNGTQTLSVNKLATAGYLTGAQLSSGTTKDSTLADLGFSGNGRITVNTTNGSTDIDVDSTKTIDQFVTDLKNAGVNASFDAANGRMFISAKESGAANDFSITGANSKGIDALNKLGINLQSTATTAAYEAYGKYAMNDQTPTSTYFALNAAGEYTFRASDGLYAKNGSYSSTATQAYMGDVYDALQRAHTDLSTATTANAELNRKIAYANAENDNTAALAGVSQADKNKLNGLLGTSATYAQVLGDGTVREYTGRTENDDGTYTYTYLDSNGDEQTVDDAQDYSVAEQLDALSKQIFTKGVVDGDGNPVYEDDGVTQKTELDSDAWNTYKSNYETVKTFALAAVGDTAAENFMRDVTAAVNAGGTAVTDLTDQLSANIAANDNVISTANATIAEYSVWDSADIETMSRNDFISDAMDKIETARNVLNGNTTYSSGATRVNGTDAEITLNGASFTSSSNKFEINGLTINATATTSPGEEITITTSSDTQATYDKIKDFLTQYNEVMNSLSSLYNADSAKGYDPLTDEEKEEMSDTEIEKWETKVKDSLLRRDQTLSSIMSTISNGMTKSYSVTMADGSTKNLSLASLGIKTGGYFSTSANDRYAYHIDGDSDDDLTSTNADKLMAMIEEDPDAVESLMKQVTQGLYSSLDARMKSTTMSSAYTIYNDKEMKTEYSTYTSQIKTWETRLSDLEERYYKQFAAMEKALATLNSNSSSLGSFFGG